MTSHRVGIDFGTTNSALALADGRHVRLASFPFLESARAGNADLRNGFGLALETAKLGQPLYRKQEPTGYSSLSEEWRNSASLLGRMNPATAFAQNRISGLDVRWAGRSVLPAFLRAFVGTAPKRSN